MIGRNAQRLTSVHNVFAQSQCQRCYAVFGTFVTDRVVVERSQHTRYVGIVASVILLAHHFLQNHSHLLLVYHVARSRHVRLRILIVHRSVHALDGTRQHLEHGIFVLKIRNHICGVYSCKGLIVGVLQQRARTYGNRTLHRLKEGEEVGYQRVGQLCVQEVVQYLVVRSVAQGYLIQVVLLHELVEHVGAEYHGLGYLHARSGKRIEVGMSLDDVVEECQTTTFASQRAFAYACKVRVGVKLHAVEHSHYAQILHVAVLHDGVEDDFAVGSNVLQTLPCNLLQILRYGENGSCRKPTAHVIARDMIEHRVVWNLEDVVLQFLQRVYAHYLSLCLGVAEDEVAESHVFFHNGTQVD